MKVNFLHIILFSLVVFSSCKKKEATPEPVPVTPPAPQFGDATAEYVKFTLKDSTYSYSPPSMGTWASGSPAQILSGTGTDPNRVSFYRSYYGSNTIIFSLSKNDSTRQAPNTAVSNDLQKDAFKTGDYVYSSGYDHPKNLGVSLSFRDKNGDNWRTQKGNGSSYQGTAVFKIEESASYTKGQFYHTKIKAVINCKVYNSNTGDSTQITNGEAIISFFK